MGDEVIFCWKRGIQGAEEVVVEVVVVGVVVGGEGSFLACC